MRFMQLLWPGSNLHEYGSCMNMAVHERKAVPVSFSSLDLRFSNFLLFYPKNENVSSSRFEEGFSYQEP